MKSTLVNVSSLSIFFSEGVSCWQILRRYDITLIQEIRDSSETAIYELLEDVNNAG